VCLLPHRAFSHYELDPLRNVGLGFDSLGSNTAGAGAKGSHATEVSRMYSKLLSVPIPARR
jgi:hypothetical protein